MSTYGNIAKKESRKKINPWIDGIGVVAMMMLQLLKPLKI
jgi:hypothetical protein